MQNKLKRLLTGSQYNTPTTKLLQIAFQTITMTHEILKSRKPSLAMKIQERQVDRNCHGRLSEPNLSLSISKEGFIYRGIKLMNMLDASLRSEHKLENFKARLWQWVKCNINAKPKSKYPALGGRTRRLTITAEQAPPANLITRYFQPVTR